LYEDNHLIAVFKPVGMLSQSDHTGVPSLWDLTKLWLKEKYDKPGNVFLGLVHRIDKPVAGVVLFAKTSKAASRLSENFRTRQVDKEYLALVEGELPATQEILVDYLIWEEDLRRASVTQDTSEAKKSSLEYRVLRKDPRGSLLAIKLHTGRKHQIRIQFSHRGHPILGDRAYGSTENWEDEGIALAAKRIAFPHPVKEERLSIEVPLGLISWEGIAR
jgi:23S rRNA pseudouridine1911/1915/1917 synthase